MTKFWALVAVAAASGTAHAAAYTTNVILDVRNSDGGYTYLGKADLSSPLFVQAGDTVDLNITFPDSKALHFAHAYGPLLAGLGGNLQPPTYYTYTFEVGNSSGAIASNGSGGPSNIGFLDQFYVLAGTYLIGEQNHIEGSLTSFRAQFTFIGGNPATLTNAIFSIYSVPEPAAWILMISGFGFVGAAARRSRGSVSICGPARYTS